MDTMLRNALILVVSDHGNFLLRKSLITIFPKPRTKEYMVQIRKVIPKFRSVFSLLKNKKKNKVVPNVTQSNMIMLLRFMCSVLGFKINPY